MSEQFAKFGFDRNLTLRWADYSLDLAMTDAAEEVQWSQLKTYLFGEIAGGVTASKTAGQLKRLWLARDDECLKLRSEALEIARGSISQNHAILHFGMALNVFPIFREICVRMGEVCRVQQETTTRMIINRVSVKYLSPNFVPQVVRRTTQTLVEWGLVERDKKKLRLRERSIEDHETGMWFVRALIAAERRQAIPLKELSLVPEKLGVTIHDVRQIILQSNQLTLRRNAAGEEMVTGD